MYKQKKVAIQDIQQKRIFSERNLKYLFKKRMAIIQVIQRGSRGRASLPFCPFLFSNVKLGSKPVNLKISH